MASAPERKPKRRSRRARPRGARARNLPRRRTVAHVLRDNMVLVSADGTRFSPLTEDESLSVTDEPPLPEGVVGVGEVAAGYVLFEPVGDAIEGPIDLVATFVDPSTGVATSLAVPFRPP